MMTVALIVLSLMGVCFALVCLTNPRKHDPYRYDSCDYYPHDDSSADSGWSLFDWSDASSSHDGGLFDDFFGDSDHHD